VRQTPTRDWRVRKRRTIEHLAIQNRNMPANGTFVKIGLFATCKHLLQAIPDWIAQPFLPSNPMLTSGLAKR